jgi:hypothetical protein
MHNLSDEALCERWVENPYFQYFCGEVVFRHELPFDRSSLTRWRQWLGEEQIVALLQESLSVAHRTGAIDTKDLERVAIDTTVQEKAIAHPTDARLAHRAIEKLVELAKREGVELRQSYLRLANSDFTAVDSLFGDLATFDHLIAALHLRGIRLILDFVPNHTAAAHPWFRESRSSRSDAKRDWYVWVDPASDGGPPNNWLSRFGGTAWQFDPPTGQYYYHSFLKEQPDLNWHNPAVRRACCGFGCSAGSTVSGSMPLACW